MGSISWVHFQLNDYSSLRGYLEKDFEALIEFWGKSDMIHRYLTKLCKMGITAQTVETACYVNSDAYLF